MNNAGRCCVVSARLGIYRPVILGSEGFPGLMQLTPGSRAHATHTGSTDSCNSHRQQDSCNSHRQQDSCNSHRLQDPCNSHRHQDSCNLHRQQDLCNSLRQYSNSHRQQDPCNSHRQQDSCNSHSRDGHQFFSKERNDLCVLFGSL